MCHYDVQWTTKTQVQNVKQQFAENQHPRKKYLKNKLQSLTTHHEMPVSTIAQLPLLRRGWQTDNLSLFLRLAGVTLARVGCE